MLFQKKLKVNIKMVHLHNKATSKKKEEKLFKIKKKLQSRKLCNFEKKKIKKVLFKELEGIGGRLSNNEIMNIIWMVGRLIEQDLIDFLDMFQ
jgi:hypothetical protein